MKRIILLTTLIFSACQNKTSNLLSRTTEVTTSIATETITTQPANEDLLISHDGIGKAKLGMSIGELKRISDPDTSFEIISPFLLDTNAIAVSNQGIVQYYILYVAGSTSDTDGITPSDDDTITILMTDNQHYQTKEGVRVGTPIKEAEEIYGNAVLAYNTEGESREYVTFGDRKSDNIRFRASYFKLISDGLGFSGIYPEYPGVSYTTDKYREDAAIAAIEVSCALENCASQKILRRLPSNGNEKKNSALSIDP